MIEDNNAENFFGKVGENRVQNTELANFFP